MSISEQQFRTALADVAAKVTAGSIPPLALPAGQPRRRPAAGHPARISGRRVNWPRLLAPAAAAAAVVVVIAVAVAIRGGTSGPASGPRLAAQVPGFSLRSAPPYYLALDDDGTRAVIRSTRTGVAEVTVAPPQPVWLYLDPAAAADDRTFVVASLSPAARHDGGGSPVSLYEVRFDPAHRTAAVSLLPIGGLTFSILNGIALSPDGTRLAVAERDLGPGRRQDQVSVYVLATGQVRSWRGTGAFGPWQSLLSWAANDRTLALNWSGHERLAGTNACQPAAGLRLLDTATAGGSLLADSRPALPPAPGRFRLTANAILTPDGTKIVAATWTRTRRCTASPLGATTLADVEFAAGTPNPVRLLYPQRLRLTVANGQLALAFQSVLWSNRSGSVLVVMDTPVSRDNQLGPPVTGLVSGGRLIPVPGTEPGGTAVF